MTQHYSHVRHPVRKIPTKEQVAYAAKRQAQYVAADPSYMGHDAGIHPEHRPYMSTELSHTPVTFDAEREYEIEEDEAYYRTQLPTSARRYQVSPEKVYQQGNKRLHVRYVDIPKRSSQQKQLPPAHPRDRYTDEVETALPQAKQHKRSIHPLLYLGVGMLAMAALFLLLSSAANWIQTTKDDLTYGRPRTFNIDVVVGHNDSAANPTHFIAINLNRHVEVIEQPGGDASKMKVYQITTLFGDGEDLTPVTLSFRDLTGNGKLDMLIHIQDQTLVMINENGTFRPAKPGEVKGLL
jgi:hypothetical protein